MQSRRRSGGRARHLCGLTCAALLISACSSPLGLPGGGGEKATAATSAGAAFLADWAAGRVKEAAARTTDPERSLAALTEFQTELRPDVRTFDPDSSASCTEAGCTLDFGADLFLNALGAWTYRSALALTRQRVGEDDRWAVAWAPSILHPRLTEETRLIRARGLPGRAPILDRNDQPLVSNQKVIKVGVIAGQVPDGAIEDVADLLDVDVDGLRTRTGQAEAGQFVEAIVLRQSDFAKVRSRLADIKGVITREARQALAPTRSYARSVLGVVANATPASLASAGPYASAADQLGSFGLQSLYQRQLAGRPRGRIELHRRSTDAMLETLATWDEVPGTAVRTTLDRRVQDAAEAAVALTGESSSVVALDIRTGEVLAVANGPQNKAGEDRALNGQYAPGSVFKIITAAALLADGVDLDDPIDCPSSTRVDGKRFENYDGLGSLGRVSFRRNFAQSCNTAFITAAGKLSQEALTQAAASFGIGGAWDLMLNSYSGDVPPATGPVDQAAAAIGQGRVLMSPLAMAVVAAAVASGTPREPRLLRSGPPALQTPTASPIPAPTAAASPAGLAPLAFRSALRELMIGAVREGPANVLAVGGSGVGGKTGTAEFGSETEPGKHAWLVGFVGDIAFAVIVERGESGARTAGPLAQTFLTRIADYARSGLRR